MVKGAPLEAMSRQHVHPIRRISCVPRGSSRRPRGEAGLPKGTLEAAFLAYFPRTCSE
jgi:hypothetical protein